jgi:hypothetical protein
MRSSESSDIGFPTPASRIWEVPGHRPAKVRPMTFVCAGRKVIGRSVFRLYVCRRARRRHARRSLLGGEDQEESTRWNLAGASAAAEGVAAAGSRPVHPPGLRPFCDGGERTAGTGGSVVTA